VESTEKSGYVRLSTAAIARCSFGSSSKWERPDVRWFWLNEFGRYDERVLREAIAPIQNKVGMLLMAAPLRNVLGQVRSRFDTGFMMDHRRIFIANLSKGRLGADKANLLGSLLVPQFQLSAIARATVPEDKREDFHLYVDEFHRPRLGLHSCLRNWGARSESPHHVSAGRTWLCGSVRRNCAAHDAGVPRVSSVFKISPLRKSCNPERSESPVWRWPPSLLAS
jgi:hypothetical protein